VVVDAVIVVLVTAAAEFLGFVFSVESVEQAIPRAAKRAKRKTSLRLAMVWVEACCEVMSTRYNTSVTAKGGYSTT
jgi:hypothetical protein